MVSPHLLLIVPSSDCTLIKETHYLTPPIKYNLLTNFYPTFWSGGDNQGCSCKIQLNSLNDWNVQLKATYTFPPSFIESASPSPALKQLTVNPQCCFDSPPPLRMWAEWEMCGKNGACGVNALKIVEDVDGCVCVCMCVSLCVCVCNQAGNRIHYLVSRCNLHVGWCEDFPYCHWTCKAFKWVVQYVKYPVDGWILYIFLDIIGSQEICRNPFGRNHQGVQNESAHWFLCTFPHFSLIDHNMHMHALSLGIHSLTS